MRERTTKISHEAVEAQRALARSIQARADAPKTYHITTYGCQMNAHDSESIAGILGEMGMAPESQQEQADLILFNTCCIRDNAERRAMGNIIFTKEIKKQRPRALVGVLGCMVQQQGAAEKLREKQRHVDFALGTGEIYRLPERILHALEGRREAAFREGEDSTLYEGMPVLRQSPFMAYLTVMYGCDNFCSYCVVPSVRGRERSRRLEDIVLEAKGLVADGVQEIMLLGQNVNSYGLDGAGPRFPALLKALHEETGVQRLRFMTSNPKDLSDELILEMSENPAVCPHLHLPAQSGSDRMLKAMNRRYTRAMYDQRLWALREAMPDIGITTDLIVAFPGETEEDFEETLDLVARSRFDSAFTFVFSPRTGTVAAELPGRISQPVARERITRLIKAQEGITRAVFEGLVGSCAQVLAEGPAKRGKGRLSGKTGRGMGITFEGGAELIGQIVPVKVAGFGSNTLKGEIMQ
ncbi:MAG: tRNA (N6-isopentenyl adenosine(37)-C2)-methylthiotransferase MiaB [Eubacteriales bacterium]|nr:tRNA (N6-isopentenyl adenosine(37)-C2)-methylthiotransferase MiaB [Eubacteriales bacterium]MDD4134152.1 tRNA (N6-isopentenyl adenosine(37)-C2)-methylthiotransferase MiaB [Eubacteriales bacterium]